MANEEVYEEEVNTALANLEKAKNSLVEIQLQCSGSSNSNNNER